MKTKAIIAAAFACTVLAAGCKKKQDSGEMLVSNTASSSRMNYTKVDVEITEVQAHYSDESRGDGGWVTLSSRAGIYDLLQLQNDVTAVLADQGNLAPGKITQLRLVLGSHDDIVINGVTYPLKTPSGMQSGIKINLDTSIGAHKITAIVLDFDIDGSIVVQGTGDYSLKPVIKVKSITQTDIP